MFVYQLTIELFMIL